MIAKEDTCSGDADGSSIGDIAEPGGEKRPPPPPAVGQENCNQAWTTVAGRQPTTDNISSTNSKGRFRCRRIRRRLLVVVVGGGEGGESGRDGDVVMMSVDGKVQEKVAVRTTTATAPTAEESSSSFRRPWQRCRLFRLLSFPPVLRSIMGEMDTL